MKPLIFPDIRCPLLLAGTTLLLGWLVQVASAAQSPQVDTERALKSLPNNSWYDKHAESYVTPAIPLEGDNPIREDGWRARPKPAKQPSNWNWNWNWDLSGWFARWFSTIALSIVALLLVLALLLLSYHSLKQYLPGRFEKSNRSKPITIDPARVSDLPFEVQASHGNPLDEAEALWKAGKLDQAIIYLYGYLLLALDQARLLHLQKGKTNRMYLKELQPRPGLRAIVELTMLAFEEVYFGKHSLTEARFTSLWSQLDDFHQQLAAAQQMVSSPSQQGAPVLADI